MANDFSGDSSCKALWRFESGALTVDSIGANTLTPHNSPGENTTTPLEGACSAICSLSANKGFDIADASLDSGFPLKSGDTAKLITVCGWFRPSQNGSVTVPFGKFTASGGDSFLFVQNGSTWSIGWSHSGGYTWWQYIGSVTTGVAYHIALVIDGVAGTAKLRIWDGTTVTNYTNTFGTTLDVGNAPFLIGYIGWGSAAFDGDIDEVVVFNRLLADDTIDLIRNGTFPPPGGMIIGGASAEVLYQEAPTSRIGGILTEVLAGPPPVVTITSDLVHLEYQVAPKVKQTQNILQVELSRAGAGFYVSKAITQLEYTILSQVVCNVLSSIIEITPLSLSLLETIHILEPVNIAIAALTMFPPGYGVSVATENILITPHDLRVEWGVTLTTLAIDIALLAVSIELISKRIFPLPPTNRLLQSQPNKRKFPLGH